MEHVYVYDRDAVRAALHAADEATVKRELEAMGVECIEPASEREQATETKRN